MNTKNCALSIAALSAAILMTSCLKQDDVYQVSPVNSISDAFKQYSAFDTNSYWVYQNELSKELDTARVFSVLADTRHHTDIKNPEGFRYEALEIKYRSGETGIVRTEITAGYKPSTDESMNESLRLYFANGRYFRILMPQYPMGQTQLLGINEGNYTNLALMDNYTLNDKNYESVFHTQVKDYQNGNDTVVLEFFLASGYGLIKYRIQAADTIAEWTLVDAGPIILEELR
jgi:hypothetical protein